MRERTGRTEAETEARLIERRAEAAALTPVSEAARRELASVEEVLSERAKVTATASRLIPPPYVTAELGERPADPAQAKLWERGVTEIERFRQENGVSDRAKAFGAEPKDSAARERRQMEMHRAQRLQRQLREQREMQRTREMGVERDGVGPLVRWRTWWHRFGQRPREPDRICFWLIVGIVARLGELPSVLKFPVANSARNYLDFLTGLKQCAAATHKENDRDFHRPRRRPALGTP